MVGRWAATATALLLLAAGLVASVATGQTSTTEPTSTWTDPSYRGDVVYHVEVDVGTSNDCTFVFRFGGTDTDDRALRWWRSSASLDLVTSSREPVGDHVRVGSLSYETDEPITGVFWATNLTLTGRLTGTETFTAAGFDVSTWSHQGPGGGLHPHPGAGLTVDCAEPYTITELTGSTHVLPISDAQALAEAEDGDRPDEDPYGIGASTPETSLFTPPGFSASFDEPQVVLDYETFVDHGVGATVTQLEHPEGTRTWRTLATPFTDGAEHKRFTGPSGDYTFSATHAAFAEEERVRGILGGLAPIDGLDVLG